LIIESHFYPKDTEDNAHHHGLDDQIDLLHVEFEVIGKLFLVFLLLLLLLLGCYFSQGDIVFRTDAY
jgi:hypothetical protein